MFVDRILQLKMPGDTSEISIRVFFPEGADNKWRCRYEIDWPEGRQAISATGTDGVQALSNALCMIGADLYTSSYHKEGQIQYWGDWKGYGFPVPAVIRDLLVGDDAKYF